MNEPAENSSSVSDSLNYINPVPPYSESRLDKVSALDSDPNASQLTESIDQEDHTIPGSESPEELNEESDLAPTEGSAEPTPSTSYEPTSNGNAYITQDVKENYGTVVGVLQETIRRMVDSHEFPSSYVANCMRVFVKPLNIDDAGKILQEHRVIVLPGTRGSGRHTSAVWLLRSIEYLRLREVRREPGDTLLIDDLASERGIGWLLDLRSDDDQIQLSLGRALVTSKNLLEAASSYLAVAIRADLWDQVKAGGEEVASTLIAPSSLDIVRQRLTREEPVLNDPDASSWLHHPEIISHLTSLSPIEAVAWANAIKAEHFTPLNPEEVTKSDDLEDQETLKKKVENVIKARSSWRAKLLAWHKSHQDARVRNFMLTAAVLEDCPGEQIFTAAQKLAEKFKDSTPQTSGLAGPGILELISEVDAHLSETETVRFDRAGYADSILEYFWLDRMHLRDVFIRWLSELSLGNQAGDGGSIVSHIGQYILRWSIRSNKIDQLERVTAIWAKNERLAPAAEALITAAGLDPDVGRLTRDRMLVWAKSDQEDLDPLKLMVARASSGPLGNVFPKEMFLRLGYVASTNNPDIVKAVKDAIGTLWKFAKTRDRIRADIITWCNSSDNMRVIAARRTFATLAGLVDNANGAPLLLDSMPLMGESFKSDEYQRFLIEGWRCVLDEPVPDDEAIQSFGIWMDAAQISENMQVASRRIFADAVYKLVDEDFNDRRYSTLSDLFYRWEPAGREVTSRTLLRESTLNYVRKRDPLRHPTTESYELIDSPDTSHAVE